MTIRQGRVPRQGARFSAAGQRRTSSAGRRWRAASAAFGSAFADRDARREHSDMTRSRPVQPCALNISEMINSVTAFHAAEERLEARWVVPMASPVYEGHFPGHPLMPGVLLTETMAQASGYLILGLLHFSHMPFLAGVEKAKLPHLRPPRRGPRHRGEAGSPRLGLCRSQRQDHQRRQGGVRRRADVQADAVSARHGRTDARPGVAHRPEPGRAMRRANGRAN